MSSPAAFQGAGTLVASINALTTSTGPAWPTHQTNDIGFLCVESSADPGTITGWTKIASVTAATGSVLTVYWKRAASSSEARVAIADTGDHQMAAICTIRGARVGSTPIFAYQTGSGNIVNGGDSVSATALSQPFPPDPLLVVIGSRSDDTATAWVSTTIGTQSGSITGTRHLNTGNTTGDGGGLSFCTNTTTLALNANITASVVSSGTRTASCAVIGLIMYRAEITETKSGAGGVTMGGAATFTKTKVKTGAGAVTMGGAASFTRVAAPVVRSYTMVGTITMGGSATKKKTLVKAAAGSVTTGGSAAFRKTTVYRKTMAGGVTTSGASTFKKILAEVMAGTLTTGGSATAKKTLTRTMAGTATTGGAASFRRTAVYRKTMAGGVVLAGSASYAKTRVWRGSGSLVVGGSASKTLHKVRTGSGGAATSGAAAFERVAHTTGFIFTMQGGVVLGGSAGRGKVLAKAGTGGAVVTGAASFGHGRVFTPAGGATLGGAAPFRRGFQRTMSGGVVLSGAASSTHGYTRTMSGGVVLSGTALRTKDLHRTMAGHVTMRGRAKIIESIALKYPTVILDDKGKLLRFITKSFYIRL